MIQPKSEVKNKNQKQSYMPFGCYHIDISLCTRITIDGKFWTILTWCNYLILIRSSHQYSIGGIVKNGLVSNWTLWIDSFIYFFFKKTTGIPTKWLKDTLIGIHFWCPAINTYKHKLGIVLKKVVVIIIIIIIIING